MRVICCYRKMEERSAAALAKYAPDVEMVYTGDSIWDYNEAISSRWTGEDDLVVIEEDKEITAKVLPSFAACDQLWCSYSYYVFPAQIRQQVTIGLGCTRFSAQVQRIVTPSEFLDAEDDSDFWGLCTQCNGKGCWRYLDSRIARAIRCHQGPNGKKIDVHWHGTVDHHHDYSSWILDHPLDMIETLIKRTKEPKTVKLLAQYPDDELAGPYWQKDRS